MEQLAELQNMTPQEAAVYYGVSIIISILMIIAMWKIFTKAGEAGWKAIIPIYSTYILFKIIYGSGWRFLLMLIPIVGIVISIMMDIDLARSFKKGTGFAIGLIFLYPIFLMILGFGDATYAGTKTQLLA